MISRNDFVRTNYYREFSDDIIKSKNQEASVADHYDWSINSWIGKLFEFFIRFFLKLIAVCYIKFTRISIVGVEKLTNESKFIMYGNHTQPTGDVLLPNVLSKRSSFNVIASPANLGIPIIGKLIKYGGGLPIPDSMHQMANFNNEIIKRLKHNNFLMIYPEQHVWPYYTDIRPFSKAAFHFPVENNVESFCMTTTYQRRKFFKKPKKTVFIDGPFTVSKLATEKEQQRYLSDEIRNCMKKRAQLSTYEYIHYKKKG
ncbi:lysophospholipid acyltransferase family protein [Companilactobacillus jidongensis]|uniref:lysophospholipid acyltransferase family protein n=1 Tax=Companilactobacillus jidongensis TaxID=2486006 RepID=UPI000F797266|nr:1-acyl-sn-glycerol-3-phosphate acyltransferase [Companilactobacillus jidongensis]